MNEPVKVMHLIASNGLSGAEKVAINMIKNTIQIDSVYCSPSGEIDNYLSKENINQVILSKLNKNSLKEAIDHYKPDIIHAHDFKASILASIVFKGKVISHIHQNPDWLSKKYNLKVLIYKIVSLKICKIVCVSESVKSKLKNINISSDKIIIIRNNIDNTLFDEEIIPIKNRRYDLTFVGRLRKEKRPVEFIKIVKAVKESYPNLSVALVGDGPEMDNVKLEIEKNNLNKTVKLFGFLDNPSIIMKDSKIINITSDYEGFGLAAAEAQALGLPIVSTNVGGIQEFTNEKSAIICELNRHKIEIIDLLNNESKLISMSNAARENIKKFQEVNNSIKEIEYLYKSINN